MRSFDYYGPTGLTCFPSFEIHQGEALSFEVLCLIGWRRGEEGKQEYKLSIEELSWSLDEFAAM